MFFFSSFIHMKDKHLFIPLHSFQLCRDQVVVVFVVFQTLVSISEVALLRTNYATSTLIILLKGVSSISYLLFKFEFMRVLTSTYLC